MGRYRAIRFAGAPKIRGRRAAGTSPTPHPAPQTRRAAAKPICAPVRRARRRLGRKIVGQHQAGAAQSRRRSSCSPPATAWRPPHLGSPPPAALPRLCGPPKADWRRETRCSGAAIGRNIACPPPSFQQGHPAAHSRLLRPLPTRSLPLSRPLPAPCHSRAQPNATVAFPPHLTLEELPTGRSPYRQSPQSLQRAPETR